MTYSKSVGRKIAGCLLASVLLLAVQSAAASEILFGIIGDASGFFYEANGLELAGYIGALPGVNVTVRRLDQTYVNDFGNYDQIWVYDMSYASDNTPLLLQNYQGIAAWFNSRTQQNLILDGRILASSPSWMNTTSSTATNVSEQGWIQNYAIQLDLRGGGLFLGTGHSPAFSQGINDINQDIGIGDFYGYWYQQPYEAVVDPTSPLFVPGLAACNPLYYPAGDSCLNDNASSSFVPIGFQPSRLDLTAAASVSTALYAQVSTHLVDLPHPIPAPGTLSMLAIGLLGLAARKRAPT